MAELTIPTLLAHTPESSPPGRWRILLLPAMMAIIGILIATAAAISGQDTRRAFEYATIDKNLYRLENDLAKARLNHAPEDKISELAAQVQKLQKREISGYSTPGRHFTEWDGYRYEDIAENGYFYYPKSDPKIDEKSPKIDEKNFAIDGEPRRNNVAWYPLYPALAWLITKTTGLSFVNSLTLISQTAIVLASMMLFLYARRHYYNRMPKLRLDTGQARTPAEAHPSRRWDLTPQDSAALWAVAALLYAPCSIFLFANYTESLFVLLLVTFLYCLQSRWWWRAAAIAAVASACRSQGALFGPMLALVFFMRTDVKNPVAKVGIAAVLGVLSSIGIGCYMLYLQRTFGDPLAFIHTQTDWNVGINAGSLYHALNPVNAMTNLVHYCFYAGEMDWPRVWEASCVIWPPIVLLVLGGRFLSFELELVGWLLWGLPFISNAQAGSILGDSQWMSMGRFMAVLIPAHIIIGAVLVRFRWLGVPFLAGSAAAFGVFAYKFGAGEWIG